MAGVADELAALIRAQINEGALAPGEKIPSIATYVVRGYGRGAVERALATLRAEGLIASRHGAGNYVQQPLTRVVRVPGRLPVWRADYSDSSARMQATRPVVGYFVPPPDVANLLEVPEDAQVLTRVAGVTVDGRRSALTVIYLPKEITQGTPMEHTDPGPGGIHARLEEGGFKPTRSSEQVIARAPSPDEVESLDLRRRGAVVLEIVEVAYARRRCVKVARTVLDAEVYALKYDVPTV